MFFHKQVEEIFIIIYVNDDGSRNGFSMEKKVERDGLFLR